MGLRANSPAAAGVQGAPDKDWDTVQGWSRGGRHPALWGHRADTLQGKSRNALRVLSMGSIESHHTLRGVCPHCRPSEQASELHPAAVEAEPLAETGPPPPPPQCSNPSPVARGSRLTDGCPRGLGWSLTGPAFLLSPPLNRPPVGRAL